MLNYDLMGAAYFYRARKYDRMDHCLEEVKRIYPSTEVTEAEAIALAKYFNMYYKFDWSMPLMYPFVKKQGVSEEMLFTFVRTGALFRWEVKDEEYFAFVKKAQLMNNTRFCDWISNLDYQLLRDERFKKLYCGSCGK
jgi:hypothetical protein